MAAAVPIATHRFFESARTKRVRIAVRIGVDRLSDLTRARVVFFFFFPLGPGPYEGISYVRARRSQRAGSKRSQIAGGNTSSASSGLMGSVRRVMAHAFSTARAMRISSSVLTVGSTSPARPVQR